MSRIKSKIYLRQLGTEHSHYIPTMFRKSMFMFIYLRLTKIEKCDIMEGWSDLWPQGKSENNGII